VASLPSIILNHGIALTALSLFAADAKVGISKLGTQAIDPATNTVAIPLSSNAPNIAAQMQVRASVQAGLASAAVSAGVIPIRGSVAAPVARTLTLRRLAGPPPADPVVAAGNICDPDNVSDADAATAKNDGLACQLTNQTEQVLMPSSFQNAQKGDVILSPGQDSGDNMIGALLRSLSPPQYHSHSGLMTQNYFEITHCTASPDRMTTSNNLTGIGGAGGVKPDILQYGWPGSITQTIDAAVAGERWNDPEDSSGNTSYTISGFNPEPLGIENSSNDFVLVYPMVVKPLPENEAAARPALRAAADLARSKGAKVDNNGNLTQKGGCYYCFYCYTKPEISAGFTDPAPVSTGWAAGLSPAVCSSFVWMNMKASGINLVGSNAVETVAELSSAAVAGGAEVGATTLDGLFYYSQSERQTAAQVLNAIIYNEAEQHEGFAQYIPGVGSTIAQNIADQILNMFAYNDPNKYGSSDWQKSGDANAVSPDNIPWWNPPFFGYAEQLQYLEQHTEEYTVSKWQKVTVFGAVSGTVTRQDTGAAVGGAHVSLNDSLTTTTNAQGQFQIANVPAGSYDLKAWAVVTIGGAQVQIANGPYGSAGQGQTITTTPANPNLTINVVLQTLPPSYRRLDLQFQWSSDHGDANAWHNSGFRYEGPNTASIPLGPGSGGFGNTGTYSYSYDYDHQGLFRCEYDFMAALLEDDSIEVTLTGKMIDDGSNDEQAEYTIHFNVPVDGQNSGWWISIENSGFSYHNGPAKLVGTATNNRLTS
ncbi:MAG: carboxypeptidase-like regulatory domain-containing protein, partial [Bryobacteraceae bacterium]